MQEEEDMMQEEEEEEEEEEGEEEEEEDKRNQSRLLWKLQRKRDHSMSSFCFLCHTSKVCLWSLVAASESRCYPLLSG